MTKGKALVHFDKSAGGLISAGDPISTGCLTSVGGPISAGAAIGLGNFDGLHLGHMSLIHSLTKIAKSKRVAALLYTFYEHPHNVLNNTRNVRLLTDCIQKCRIVEKTGVDSILFDRFDIAFSKMTPEEFVRDVLVKKLAAKYVVSGYNYRFGRNGAGTSETLKALSAEYGLKAFVIEPYTVNGVAASSSLIRGFVEAGDMKAASHLLGRLFSLRGEVVKGRQIGRKMGLPTANFAPDGNMAIPKPGAYVSSVKLQDGSIRRGVTSIGTNPTVGLLNSFVAETHIFDFHEVIYGQEIEVFLHRKIRDELKFRRIEELKSRIQEDILETKGFFTGLL